MSNVDRTIAIPASLLEQLAPAEGIQDASTGPSYCTWCGENWHSKMKHQPDCAWLQARALIEASRR